MALEVYKPEMEPQNRERPRSLYDTTDTGLAVTGQQTYAGSRITSRGTKKVIGKDKGDPYKRQQPKRKEVQNFSLSKALAANHDTHSFQKQEQVCHRTARTAQTALRQRLLR